MAEASARHDAWQSGENYEAYMGRWSRLIAPRFLAWLAAPADGDWLDVGCGTGGLSATILAQAAPNSLISIDPSEGFLVKARSSIADPRVTFELGDAQALGLASNSIDIAVSVHPAGTIGFYVWDYPGGGIEFMRAFWSAATALEATARDLTEDKRFPFCTPEGLVSLAESAGLPPVACTALEVPTVFADFDDYWKPFTLGGGPAPGYCKSLAPAAQARLRERLHDTLPRRADGAIVLKARAWAVKTTTI